MHKKVLGNLPRGLVFVVSAPAGTGKTTLVQMLAKEFESVQKVIGCTTRSPRPGEVPGVDYHFLTEAEFNQKVKEEEFLEHAVVFQYQYGTLKADVEKIVLQGHHAVLVIDTQGALEIAKKIEAILIFVEPPSKEEQKRRLEGRVAGASDQIEVRLECTENEMQAAHHYDYRFVNADLETSYRVLKSIFIASEHKNFKKTRND